MAFKGNHYAIHHCLEARDLIKDFLVACGWQLVGPTDTEPHRIAQDDKHARILGWFLQSNGEDGNKDLNLHLSTGYDYADRGHAWLYNWLGTGGITASQVDNIPVVGDASSIAAGATVEINGEEILVGSVDSSGAGTPGDPHYFNGCTRGYGGTTPASHDADDVISLLHNAASNYLRLYVDNYVYRDLVNPIAQSDDSGGIGWTLSETISSGGITGLDAFTSGRTFEYTTLIKPTSGAESGKMRWVIQDDGAGGLAYTRFKSAPGAVNCDIISTGWGLASGSRNQIVGTYSYFKSSSPYGFQTFQAAPGTKDMWLYGNKDGFVMVYKTGTTYRCWYWGSYAPFANPIYTNTTGDVAAGATTIPVTDPSLFAVGGKYRIVMQSYLDWVNNWDRSADISIGASPGDWPDLEGDEMVQECVVVTAVGGSSIDIELPLIFSYKSGAVIGEDPRAIVSYCNTGAVANYREMFQDGNQYLGAQIPFPQIGKAQYRTVLPAHRRQDRRTDSATTWDPWAMDGGRDTYGQLAQCRSLFSPWTDFVLQNNEHYTDKLVLVPITVGWDDGNDRESYGGYRYAHGVLPLIRQMKSSLGANSEDTVKAPWDGSMETFRIFYDEGASQWLCVGPELWP